MAVVAPAVVMIVAVVLIVLALVYYLVSTIVALRRISAGLDEVIAGVGEIVEKSAPVNESCSRSTSSSTRGSTRSRACSSRRPGLSDSVGLIEASTRGPRRPGCATSPPAPRSRPPRIGEVYTRGTLTLARLGREAPIAAASPAGEVLRNIEGGSLAARQLYPDGPPRRARRSCPARR